TPQFAWWLGHITVLFSGILYYWKLVTFSSGASYYSTSFTGAVISYSIVLYAAHKPIQFNMQYLERVLRDETFVYLMLAFSWKTQKPVFATLLPFIIYSFFHTINYLKTDIIPTIAPSVTQELQAAQSNTAQTPSTAAQISIAIQSIFNKYYTLCMRKVSLYEISIVPLVLLVQVITFRISFMTIIYYGFFVFQRYQKSALTRNAFTELRSQLDAVILKPNVPPQVQQIYTTIKGYLANFGAQSAQPQQRPAPQQ
ncbi:hypothetical protein CONCODRAFT_37514, partial [Conidiobolus coronatus NRRL 28638]